ncbi:hypothetical protein PHJA_001820100 [Phtheirospermum japonicum]|uniref:Uncharacterized protein n=1 Tax=Phtheirospermum japonicum TaxID=374723 RepID=A0A830CAX2_9LAMI|nr:hypothetical protein PHJA_001820100 [Phtheirospermum japonicum]
MHFFISTATFSHFRLTALLRRATILPRQPPSLFQFSRPGEHSSDSSHRNRPSAVTASSSVRVPECFVSYVWAFYVFSV